MGTLVSIDAWNRTTQSRVTVRAGASLNSSTLGAGGSPWEPCVSRLPRFAMQLSDDDLTGQLMVGTGELAITAKDLIYAGDWTALDWIGSPIRVYSGEGQQLADMTLEFVGRVTAGVTNADNGQAALAMEVNKTAVDVPLLRSTYGGGGGSDGDVELRGTFKPAGFGAPINVRPVLIDTINQVYQADGYGNLAGFAGVYEDLGSFGASVGNYATYAALVAAGLREGQWATCIAEGMFRLGATATGVITCDPICGADLPGTMMLRWLQVHAGVPNAQIRSADFTALTAAVQAVTGGAPKMSFWTSESVQVLDLMQRVCASCNAVPLILLDGTISVARCIGGPVAVTLNRRGGAPNVTAWAATDSPIPWWRMRMPAAKSYYVNSPSEIDYEDDVLDRGDYVSTESYRQGNVVRWQEDGARYIYTNAIASTGNAPPAAAFWSLYQSAPDATQIRYPGGGSVFDKMQSLQTQIDVTVADNVLSRGEKPQWVITYNGVTGDLNSLNARYTALGSPADITAARNDANVKVTALGTYLSGLTPAWNDPATDTPIVANDFRAAWSNALISVAAFRAAITGRKGDPGEDGRDGTDGVPGGPGADGRTSYAHYAYANSPSGSVDFTTGFPEGRAFIGFYSDFVPADSTDPARYEWSAYKGPANFGLVPQGQAIVASSSLVQNSYTADWVSGGYSAEGWRGGAQTSFRLDADTFGGLNTDPLAGPHYSTIDYSWHCSSGGQTYIYESGVSVFTLPGGNDGSRVFQIVYDNTAVRYYVNGAVVYEHAVAAGKTLYFAASLVHGPGNKVYSITFNSVGRAGLDGNGLPGAPGADGRTQYTHYAYANSLSGTVDFTTDVPAGRAYEGSYVDFNSADSGNPAAYTWREYKGPPFGMAARGYAVVAGNQVIKNGGPVSWDSDAYSTVGYNAGASTSFRLVSDNVMAGLNQDPTTDASYGSLDYAFYRTGSNLYAFEGAVNVASFGPVSDADILQIQYDNKTIAYYKNGVVLRQYALSAGRTYYFDSSINDPGARIVDVAFGPAGAAGNDGSPGVPGGPGNPGADAVLLTLSLETIIVAADSTGVTKAGALPRMSTLKVMAGSADVTGSSSISLAVSDSGIGASYGGGVVTVSTANVAGYIDVNAVYAGATFTRRLTIVRQKDAAPPASQSSAAKQVSAVVLATTYNDSAASQSVILSAGSGGKFTAYFSAEYYLEGGSGSGNQFFTPAGKIQYRSPGGGWNDMGAEVTGSQARVIGGSPEPGTIGISQSVTGLSPNATYEVRVSFRKTSGGTGTQAVMNDALVVSQ